MYKIVIILSVFFFSIGISAQELNCKVVVNSDRLPDGNKSVFKTLETSLNEFVNKTHWTNKDYKKQERIECSMIVTILKEIGSNSYSGNIQVQSSRPVFNSIYTTPLFNFQDNNLSFSYTEFEPLRFNENSFQSDLISIVSYYANLILAIDGDSFSKYGGDQYYNKCESIISLVENGNDKSGWESDTNKLNRYNIIKEILDRSNREYRKTLYNYHINGLDTMEKDVKTGKNALLDAVMNLKKVYENDMTSPVLRIFMDAKADEIVKIFSDGPNMDTRNLVDALNRMSATNAAKWAEIK